jgi:hypothetical protein
MRRDRDAVELPMLPTCPVCRETQFPTHLGGAEHDVCRIVHSGRIPAAEAELIVVAHRRLLALVGAARADDRRRAYDRIDALEWDLDEARSTISDLASTIVDLAEAGRQVCQRWNDDDVDAGAMDREIGELRRAIDG